MTRPTEGHPLYAAWSAARETYVEDGPDVTVAIAAVHEMYRIECLVTAEAAA